MSDPRKIVDGLLVLQYRSGKKQALSLLVRKYHKRLCRHAYGFTHDIATSKDIVQECWSTIIFKIDGLKEPNHFGSWAFRIVTRKSLDYLKKEKRYRTQLHGYAYERSYDGLPVDTASDVHRLQLMIRNLPEGQQLVLRLFYTEEYSLKEIADILEISLGTVKSRLYHARERLNVNLNK